MASVKHLEKHQWKKGVSGNPKGRPKKLIDDQFLVDLWDKEGGTEAFAKAVTSGEQWAIVKLMDKLFPNKKESQVSAQIEVTLKCQRCEILLSGTMAGAHNGNFCEDCLK